MRTITINVNNLDEGIRELEAFKESFNENVTEYVDRMTEIGVDKAQEEFSRAIYDGTKDVVVSANVNKNEGTITATGKSVLFIEFGTGIHYGGGHPEAGKLGYAPGSYGPKGLKDKWVYYGEGGTNGKYLRSSDKGDVYMTHGNPANKCMYNARKEIEEQAYKVAREVFK